MRACQAIALLLLIWGCKGTPKPINGLWSGGDGKAKMAIQFDPNGKFRMFVGNDVGAGAVDGTYDLSMDNVVLTIPQLGTTLHYSYHWHDASSLLLKGPDSDPTEYLLVLQPGQSIPAVSPQDVQNARVTAERISCASNLKQIGLATLMYAQDFDNTLPAAEGWDKSLMPYLKVPAVLSCPTLAKVGKQGGYAYDNRLGFQKTTAIPSPQSVAMFYESVSEFLGASDAGTSLLRSSRHDGKINEAYVDGHVRSN